MLDAHAQETDAVVDFTAPHGTSELKIQWAGGLSVINPVETPLPGAASAGVRVIDTHLQGKVLTLVADVRSDRASHLQMRTAWKVTGAEGAEVSFIAPDMLEVTFAPSDAPLPTGSYRRVQAVLHLKK